MRVVALVTVKIMAKCYIVNIKNSFEEGYGSCMHKESGSIDNYIHWHYTQAPRYSSIRVLKTSN